MEFVGYSEAAHIHNAIPKCPVCRLSANVYKRKAPPTDVWEGKCAVCGVIRVTDAALEEIERSNQRHLIPAWLRRGGAAQLEVIDQQHVQQAIKASPNYSVLERLDLTLQAIADRTGHPGEISTFSSETDFPLIYASGSDEALFYVRELKDLGFLHPRDNYPRLTARGFQRLSEIQKTGLQSSFVFVAMWFDRKMDNIYREAISAGIRRSGYEPLRIDKHEHSNRIDDEIIAQIRRSRFMVADFTGQRAGVYFEAGMMLGLGRTVIWMCEKGELKAVHFDTRQYNFIDYENVTDARERLVNRILALEGEGPRVRDVK